MTPLEIVFTSIGGTAALVGILGWLTKSFVSHLLDKDIEKFKLQLISDKNIEIEKLKHDLSKISSEHKVRFEKLHTRRDEVIATLYSHIVEFQHAIELFLEFAFIFNDKGIEEYTQKLWPAVDTFKKYSEKHRIYFSEDICNHLDNLYKVADKPTSMLIAEWEASGVTDELIPIWKTAKETLDGEFKDIRTLIENDFRKIVGVSK